jgi:hypothetical protein
VQTVYSGFLTLLGCKWLHTPGEASPFTWKFAAAWCGLNERTVAKAMRWLLGAGYIQCTGKYRRMSLFLPR